MKRLLPLLTFAALALAVYSYLPLRRESLYTFGYFNRLTDACCSIEEIVNASGELIPADSIAVFNNEAIDVPVAALDSNLSAPAVLGESSPNQDEKWIEISLSEQLLTAWEGDRKFTEFKISSGKWGRTPLGTFRIWYKTRVQKMEGGSKALGTYYNLPNVPHNMFFYGDYAIHGAYWHNNFGQPMSHGCVNSPLAEVGPLFDWTGPKVPEGKNVVRASNDNPGTKVVIHK